MDQDRGALFPDVYVDTALGGAGAPPADDLLRVGIEFGRNDRIEGSAFREARFLVGPEPVAIERVGARRRLRKEAEIEIAVEIRVDGFEAIVLDLRRDAGPYLREGLERLALALTPNGQGIDDALTHLSVDMPGDVEIEGRQDRVDAGLANDGGGIGSRTRGDTGVAGQEGFVARHARPAVIGAGGRFRRHRLDARADLLRECGSRQPQQHTNQDTGSKQPRHDPAPFAWRCVAVPPV